MNDQQELVLTEEAKSHLFQAAKWARFLAIVGFIMVGLMVLLGLFSSVFISAFESEEFSAFPSALFTGLYVVIAAVYFFPTYYLFRFASRTRDALSEDDSDLLEGGLEQLKSCFRFMGILVIIMLALYAFGFVMAFVAMMVAG